MNLYGTWELSWTCLDCSQAVQVGPKYRQVARSFADGVWGLITLSRILRLGLVTRMAKREIINIIRVSDSLIIEHILTYSDLEVVVEYPLARRSEA